MLTRIQAREIDRRAIEVVGIPSLVLMENAGRGCAETLLSQWPDAQCLLHEQSPMRRDRHGLPTTSIRPAVGAVASRDQADHAIKQGVVICCGPGNNGGDGFVVARHLWLAGVNVKVILFAPAERYRGDALINLTIVKRLALPLVPYRVDWDIDRLQEELKRTDDAPTAWIVDAILGTGAEGELADPIRLAVKAINNTLAKRMAIDLPTGLDCDTGTAAQGAVIADVTCTFVSEKAGFQNESAQPFLGQVVVVGIGAPGF